MKKVLFLLIAIIFAIQGWTQVDIQVGSGTTYYYDPLPGWFGWNRSAYLYKASEINAGGVINSISFQIQAAGGSTNKLKIYLVETSITSMPGLSATNWNALKTGATLVYTNNAFSSSPTGWKTLTLDLPFAYSGVDNLMVLVEGEGCGTSGGCSSQCYNHSSAATHWYMRKDTSAPDDNAASTSSTGYEGTRANIKFNISPLGNYCYPPAQLTASNIAQYSANISWTTHLSGSSWVIQYKPSSSSAWSAEEYTSSGAYSLSGLSANTTYNVRVKSQCPIYSNESGWNNISFTTLVSCPAPTNLTVPLPDITTTNAIVTWNPSINPISWNEGYLLQYKPSSVSDWNSATSVSSIQDTFYLISGINPATTYNVRLRAVCDPGVDSSSWTSIVNFTTDCGSISSPWIEGFENTWASTALAPGNSVAPSCWININGGASTSYLWRKSTTSTVPAYVRTGTGAAQLYGANNAMGDYLISPVFTLTGNEMLSFYGKGYSSTTRYPEHLWIKIYDVTTNGDLLSVSDTTHFIDLGLINDTNQYTWKKYEFSLNHFVGDFRIAFVRTDNVGYYYQLDDLSIDAMPSCPNTYSLVSTGSTTTDINLTWNQTNSNGSGWEIVYADASTFDTITATPIIVTDGTALPYTISGLNPQTLYKFAVRQNCGGTFSNIITANTSALPATIPYTCDFEGSNAYSWIISNGTSTSFPVNKWYVGSVVNSAPITGNSLYISNDNGVSNAYTVGSACAVSASRLIVSDGSGEYSLEFDIKIGGESSYDFIKVFVTDPDTNYLGSTENPPYWGSSTYNVNQVIKNYNGTAPYFNGYNGTAIVAQNYHKEVSIPYFGPAGTIKKLIFVWRNDGGGGTQPPAAIDNISITSVPCSQPTAPTADNVTGNSMDISWNEYGQATEWLLDYKHIDSTTWNTVHVLSQPYTLSNLEPRNVYQFRVRGLCNGASDTSNFSGTNNYGTSCELISEFPWSFGFDGAWFVPSGISNGTKPFCWININGGTAASVCRQTATAAYIRSGTGAAQFYSGSTTNASKLSDWFITPQISLTGNQFLRFWAKGSSTYIDSLAIVAFDITSLGHDFETSDTISNFTYIMPRTKIPADPYTQYEVDLSQLNGDYRIGFVVNSSSGGYYLNLDDILIDNYAACIRPSNLTASNATENSIELSWTPGTVGDNSWYVYYKQSQASVYDSLHVFSNPYSLTGLNPSITYEWYVKTDCGVLISEESIHSLFSTECGIITQLPWSEGFELSWQPAVNPGNKPSPHCWTVIDRGGTYSTYEYWWKQNTNATYVHSGIGSAQCYTDYGTTDHNDWLITPQINLNNNERLRFWAMRMNSNTSEPDEISVFISDEDITLDTTGMGQYGNMSNFTQIFNQMLPIGSWQQYEVNLSQYSGNHYIAFVRKNTPNGYTLRLDDVSIEELPTCMRPSNITFTNLAPTQVDINFVEGRVGDNTWWVYYKPLTSTNFDSIQVNTNPYTLQNLTSNTTYNIYMRTDCGSELSESTSIYSFRTACDAISTFPWTEGFENTWVATADAVIPSNYSHPYCWINFNGGNSSSYWTRSTSSTYIHTGSGVAYMYGGSGSTYVNSDWLISPTFELTGNERIKFWTKKSSTSYTDEISLYIYDVTANGDILSMADTVNFVRLMNSTPQTTSWVENEVSLGSFVGNYRIAFVRNVNLGGGYLSLDDIQIDDTLSSCAKPTALHASNITTTNAEISWINGRLSDNSWWLYYKESTATDYDSVHVTTNPFILQNLLPSIGYNLYIKTDCGSGLSEPSSIYTFRTACDAISALPYVENFDSYGGTGTAYSPICWTRMSTYSTNYPYIGSTTFGGSAGSLYFWSSATTYSILTTPQIDPSIDITTLRVKFKLYGGTIYTGGMIQVGVMTDPTDITTFVPVDLIQNITATSQWQDKEVSLASYTGNGRYIALNCANFSGGGYLDNFEIDYIPSCAKPTSVAATNGIGTSVDVTFTPGNTTDNSWYVYYKPTISTTWDSINVTSIPATLSNLVLQTTYQIYVKTDCGNGEMSEASNIITYTTPCNSGAINTFPWTEEFEGGLTCWQQEYVVGTKNWTTNIEYPSQTPIYSGTGFANITNTSSGNNTTKLITPLLDITSLSSPYISFWHMQMAYNSNIDELKVFYRTDASSAWVQLLSYPSSIASYQKDSIALPNPSATYQIAFEGHVTNGYGVALDDITVYDNLTVPCPDPTSVLVQNVTITTADVSWVAGGSETSWEVRLGTTGTPVSVTSPTYQLPGLTPGTTYTVYVRANCGYTYSSWVSQTFTTIANTPPNVITDAPISIAQTIATLNGTITAGTEAITAQGFEWRAIGTTTWTTVNATGTTITYPLTGLTANTAYEFRAFATIASGTIYGTTLNFTTLPEGVTPPTVVTNMATSIAQTIATLNGTITAGTETITAQGFEWRAVGTTTWTTANATGTTITYPLTSLIANTAYEFRAFATTASGTTNGTTLNFTTLPNVSPTVVTNMATSIAQTIATLNGTITAGTETITAQGFEWRAVGTTTWTTVNATGATITYPLTGLTANTAYEFRAFATTASGTTNGTTLNFTTLPNLAPTVVTNMATSIAQTIATLNGTITAGTETITAQGFEWRAVGTTTWTTVNATGATITYPLTGLTANTAYEFRAFATTASGTIYGTTLNFTTDPTPVVLGEVITLNPTNVLDHSATLHGTLVNVGNALTNIKVGFVYSTITNPFIGGTNVITDTVTYTAGMTTFNKSIVGLLPATNYYCKAYVTNAAGTAYGEEKPFLTSGLNYVSGEKFSVTMFPNPTKNTTKLVVSGVVGETKVVISDVQGRTINTINAKSVNGVVEETIDVNNLAKGVYYVRIQNANTSRTQKLIVID